MARMSDMPPGFGFPFGGDPEQFKDAPLFRELQRVMSSSSGPVNWELARQVGDRERRGGGRRPRADRRRTARSSRTPSASRSCTWRGSPGWNRPPTSRRSAPVRRAEWVTANAESLRDLLEPAAQRIGEAMDRATARCSCRPEMQADGRVHGAALARCCWARRWGRCSGSSASGCSGSTTWRCRGAGPDALLFVVPNIAMFEQDWSLDPTDFRTWVALHEVTHRFEFARPWARERFRGAARRLPVHAHDRRRGDAGAARRRSTPPTPRRCRR